MYINKLKIGNVELENNILLAPMAGITDKPFRKMDQDLFTQKWLAVKLFFIMMKRQKSY